MREFQFKQGKLPDNFAPCRAQIPPPWVAHESKIGAAGLYLVEKFLLQLGNGPIEAQTYVLYLHDHKRGHLVRDGFCKADETICGMPAEAFLRKWMSDRGVDMMEGEDDGD